MTRLIGKLVPKDNGYVKIPATFYTNGLGGGGGTSDYSELENKPTINGVELNGDKDASDLGLEDKVSVIILDDNTITLELSDNTIYNCGTISALTILIPLIVDVHYISQVNFTSGNTATTFTAPNDIVWFGDDLVNNVFVPSINKRYVMMFYFDGTNIRGIVQSCIE